MWHLQIWQNKTSPFGTTLKTPHRNGVAWKGCVLVHAAAERVAHRAHFFRTLWTNERRLNCKCCGEYLTSDNPRGPLRVGEELRMCWTGNKCCEGASGSWRLGLGRISGAFLVLFFARSRISSYCNFVSFEWRTWGLLNSMEAIEKSHLVDRVFSEVRVLGKRLSCPSK